MLVAALDERVLNGGGGQVGDDGVALCQGVFWTNLIGNDSEGVKAAVADIKGGAIEARLLGEAADDIRVDPLRNVINVGIETSRVQPHQKWVSGG